MVRILPVAIAVVGMVSNRTAAADVDFAHQIVPIFKQFCTECHTGDKKKGGFSLNTRESMLAGGESGKAVVVGKSAASELVKRLATDIADLRMPPKGPRVPAEKAAMLRAWIDQGAKWEDGFTFAARAYEPPLKPRRPDLPPALPGRTNPIDRIVDAHLAKSNQPRPVPTDDASFYRRLSLDLHGQLPDPERVAAFAADARPDKHAQLVRELLADDVPYAEHWLTFWNDLLRNDYQGTGFITGGRKQITPWLYAALLDNKRYDAFVRELVNPTAESEGFARGIQWRGEVSAGQTIPVQYAQNVAQAFLGINLKCASCHDSFIDRWKLTESYALAAVYSTSPLPIHRCDKPTGQTAVPGWLFPELGTIDPKAAQSERLRQLAALMTHPENGRLTRTLVNRFWQRLMGRGIVQPTDAMHTEPWSSDLLDTLAVHLADNGYDLKKSLELIATSEAYRAKTAVVANEDGPFRFAGPLPKRMTAEQFVDAVWQVTGAGPRSYDAAVIRLKSSSASAALAGSATVRVWGARLPARAALSKADVLQRSLGRPNRDQIVSLRPTGLTTLEAIDLANHQTLADTLERGAKNLLVRKLRSPEDLATWVFRFALSRTPTADELAAARGLLGETPTDASVQDLLWAVFMLPEFQLVR